jgi:5-methylcytosine-specific restriction endonuclease McrA
MSFDNYGEWHVDHKIPLSAHNYETPDDEDFKRAWALKNLQPMWGPENISKGAKLDKEFQPSLALH